MAKQRTIREHLRIVVDMLQSTVTSTSHNVCEVYSTHRMTCPMCGVSVPPRTPHRCESRSEGTGRRGK